MNPAAAPMAVTGVLFGTGVLEQGLVSGVETEEEVSQVARVGLAASDAKLTFAAGSLSIGHADDCHCLKCLIKRNVYI
jgi:hypothetical protein